MFYFEKLSERTTLPDVVVLRPFVPEIRPSRQVVNGQIVDCDGEIVEVDLSASSIWSFSDFSVANLSAVGHPLDGYVSILPSRFAVVDNLSKNLE